MKEEFQKAILDLFNKAVVAVEKGADFLAGQVPDVVQQYLTYYLLSSVVWLFVGVLILVAGFTIINIFVKPNKKKKEEWDEDRAGIALGIVAVSTVVSAPFIITNILSIIKVTVAPKLILLEKMAELVR